MARMTEFLNSCACYILIFERSSQAIRRSLFHEMDPDCVRQYDEYFASICPRREYSLKHPDVQLFADYSHIDEGAMERDEFYRYLKDFHLRYYLAAKVADTADSTAYVTFQRTKRQGHVQDPELKKISLLLPHLERAVELNQRLGSIETRLDAFEDVLDRNASGIVLLDDHGNVAFMNAAARDIVGRNDGLSVHRQRLSAAQKIDSQKLNERVRASISNLSSNALDLSGRIAITRPSGQRPFVVEIFPLRQSEAIFAPNSRVSAVVFIVDPEATVVPSRDTLISLFGLTTTEAKLAIRLADGGSLKEAGDALGIAKETARFHLKAVFQKTETSRQSELVRLLVSGIAGSAGEPKT